MSDPLAAAATPASWSFEGPAVAGAFDGHVRAQLPWYPALSSFVTGLVASFLPRDGLVCDVGASTGNITGLLAPELAAKGARALSIEPSLEMVSRFAGHGQVFGVSAEQFDFSHRRPNVIVCFLTLMFVSPAWRFDLVRKMASALLPGGALLIVDKGHVRSSRLHVACKAAQLAGKLAAGTTAEAYCAKELALRGTQFPIDEPRLAEMLEGEGLDVANFFRFGEFFGLAAIKPEA